MTIEEMRGKGQFRLLFPFVAWEFNYISFPSFDTETLNHLNIYRIYTYIQPTLGY